MNARRPWTLCLAGQLLCGVGWAAERDPMVPTTTPPIIYTINYTDEYFKDPAYIEQFRAAPPDLLHVGKAVPITHHWGPIRLLRGENQYTGGPGHTLSWENIALISPEELAKRIDTIRRTLDRYHTAGIREITPYISYHTVAGDHEKRLGFWKFYDEWDTYARWAGPPPPHDPFDWLVVDARGKFIGGSCGGYSPDYYAPLHRYRACINHPDWAEWHRRLVRMVAEVGYDGCFVDNCHPDPCYCPYCKAAFRSFLEKTCRLDWVARLAKGVDIARLQLDSQGVSEELVRRFRLSCTSDHLAMLRRVGREIKPSFTIFPNGNSLPECLITGAQCDRLMFESTYSPGILAAGEPPPSDEIAIAVSAKEVRPEQITHHYAVADPATRIELEADVSLPSKAQVGQSVELQVKVATVGVSDRDNDTADDFVLVLREAERGEEVRLKLGPGIALGASGPSGRGKRPPATLKVSWTPTRPGLYAAHFGFHYADGGTSNTHLARLVRDQMVRSHQATLQFTQHMHARSICLGYEATRSGWENVQELAIAETAAFSGGGGFSSRGKPQAKYHAFFKAYPELFDGWQQTAPAAVLYAYWGRNPFSHVRPYGRPAIHDELARTHRPFVALLDAALPEAPDRLGRFRVIYLPSAGYEMSALQLKALREYVAQGGCVVLADETLTINGSPASELFEISKERPVRGVGRGRVVLWSWDQPTLPTPAIAPADGLRQSLRFAAYRKADQLALHAVNYNVCLLDGAKRVLDVEPTPVELAVPSDWTSAQATCYDPDAEPQPIPCTISDGTARLTLPKIHVYKVALLSKRD